MRFLSSSEGDSRKTGVDNQPILIEPTGKGQGFAFQIDKICYGRPPAQTRWTENGGYESISWARGIRNVRRMSPLAFFAEISR